MSLDLTLSETILRLNSKALGKRSEAFFFLPCMSYPVEPVFKDQKTIQRNARYEESTMRDVEAHQFF